MGKAILYLGDNDRSGGGNMSKWCKHGLGEIYENPIREKCLFCEIYDNQRNIDLGECIGNCDCEEPEEKS